LVSPRFFILLEGASKILLLAFGQGKDAFFAIRGESLLSSVENDTFFVEDKTSASYKVKPILQVTTYPNQHPNSGGKLYAPPKPPIAPHPSLIQTFPTVALPQQTTSTNSLDDLITSNISSIT
ncbi:hypothetical protein Tco_1278084, partial [Tanacetum coccineum]